MEIAELIIFVSQDRKFVCICPDKKNLIKQFSVPNEWQFCVACLNYIKYNGYDGFETNSDKLYEFMMHYATKI